MKIPLVDFLHNFQILELFAKCANAEEWKNSPNGRKDVKYKHLSTLPSFEFLIFPYYKRSCKISISQGLHLGDKASLGYDVSNDLPYTQKFIDRRVQYRKKGYSLSGSFLYPINHGSQVAHFVSITDLYMANQNNDPNVKKPQDDYMEKLMAMLRNRKELMGD